MRAVLSFVVFAELPGGHADYFFEDSCEVALVVVADLEADYRTALFSSKQQSLGVVDAYAREGIRASAIGRMVREEYSLYRRGLQYPLMYDSRDEIARLIEERGL